MSKKIISANYRDRNSELNWLVRNHDQSPEEAVAFKSVYATGVEFKQSSAYELGFGCDVVAHCETADGYAESFELTDEDRSVLERLDFGRILLGIMLGAQSKKLNTLYLDADGHMFYGSEAPVSHAVHTTEQEFVKV